MPDISTRAAYGQALAEHADEPRIVVLDADLSTCTMTQYFAQKENGRFFNCGIAEANMVCVGAGLAACGNIPFVNSFAMFMAGRCFEQIRNAVAYPNLNVKLVGTHAGLSVGEDGATHQCLEDVGIMRCIPNMTILNPCDANETCACVEAAIAWNGPVYLRLGRPPLPEITGANPNYHFRLGKGVTLRRGHNVAIIATGLMVHEALKAAVLLAEENIEAMVVDIHTIKPLDSELILQAAQTGAMVVAEEHNIYGGLCDGVAQILLDAKPVPMERVAVRDCFGHSGRPDELLNHYGLSAIHIASAAESAVRKKKIGFE